MRRAALASAAAALRGRSAAASQLSHKPFPHTLPLSWRHARPVLRRAPLTSPFSTTSSRAFAARPLRAEVASMVASASDARGEGEASASAETAAEESSSSDSSSDSSSGDEVGGKGKEKDEKEEDLLPAPYQDYRVAFIDGYRAVDHDATTRSVRMTKDLDTLKRARSMQALSQRSLPEFFQWPARLAAHRKYVDQQLAALTGTPRSDTARNTLQNHRDDITMYFDDWKTVIENTRPSSVEKAVASLGKLHVMHPCDVVDLVWSLADFRVGQPTVMEWVRTLEDVLYRHLDEGVFGDAEDIACVLRSYARLDDHSPRFVRNVGDQLRGFLSEFSNKQLAALCQAYARLRFADDEVVAELAGEVRDRLSPDHDFTLRAADTANTGFLDELAGMLFYPSRAGKRLPLDEVVVPALQLWAERLGAREQQRRKAGGSDALAQSAAERQRSERSLWQVLWSAVFQGVHTRADDPAGRAALASLLAQASRRIEAKRPDTTHEERQSKPWRRFPDYTPNDLQLHQARSYLEVQAALELEAPADADAAAAGLSLSAAAAERVRAMVAAAPAASTSPDVEALTTSLARMEIKHGRLYPAHHGLYHIHAAFAKNRVAVELRPATDRTVDSSASLLGRAQLRERLLTKLGWHVLPIEQADFKNIYTRKSLEIFLIDRLMDMDLVDQ